jgi:hypothetical protein
MITPKELFAKAEKSFFKVIFVHFKGDAVFPLAIPSNKQITGTNFTEWKNDLIPLHEGSKASKGKGYSVKWAEKKINGSKQSIPTRIYFETLEDFLYFTKKYKEFQKIVEARNLILSRFPLLLDWVDANPAILLENFEAWSDIIKVCHYFVTNPPPHDYYIRELPIEVHTKFVEDNSSLLKKMLDRLLPSEWINASEADFISRYFLKKVKVYTQIRILDEDLKPYLGYDECSLTLDDAAWLKWTPEKVFIIENQTCFLTFPKVKNSVAIFGEGFKSRLNKHLPWLDKTQLFCWFDMDTAGFEILNMIRGHYPTAASFLMDQNTYSQFEQFSVPIKRGKKDLPYLSPEEQKFYQFLFASNKRLDSLTRRSGRSSGKRS